MLDVAADDARRVALHSVGLLSPDVSPAVAQRASARRQSEIVRGMLADLGAVQLDTISVLARSHELIAYARYGAIRRTAIEGAYWSDAHAFEYWSHAACILPMDMWPLFAFRRRGYRAKGQRWHKVPKRSLDGILAKLRDLGPVTTADVGGAKQGGAWWDWSESKIGLEWLLDIGEIVVTQRVGFRRTYDLAERAVPDAVRHDDRSDDECLAALVAAGASVMGIGTAADIADVHRIPVAAVQRHAAEVGLVAVKVPGWTARAWAASEALTWLGASERDRHRTTLLSPFDPLVWRRDRAERIFGMTHRLEAYTPAHKRVHGYFAMPVLHRGRLVARVDPKRDGSVLHARVVTLESASAAAVDGVARAVWEAASWVGCDRVEVGAVAPQAARRAVVAAVTAAAPA